MIGTAARLIAVALLPYFAWEMLQASAFTGMPSGGLRATLVCAMATLGDMVILILLYALSVWVFGAPQWFAPPIFARYALILLVAVIVHVGIERLMVGLGRWGYAPGHPVVPFLDVGVLVVLQPLVLVPLVFAALARWERAQSLATGLQGPSKGCQ
jgi:hypothetical protein